MPIPDFNELINSITSSMPDLFDAFWRGGQYAIGIFILIGIIYFLRRYL
jgi:hypothetical protein